MVFMKPERVRELSQPEKFGNVIPMYSGDRLQSTIDLINTNQLDTRMRQKWNAILAVDNAYQIQGPVDPFNMPEYYDDPVGNQAVTSIIRNDGMAAVDLGIRWRILGNIADAEAVARILDPWSQIQTIAFNGAARLVWSNSWELFIQAAQLISNSTAYTTSLKNQMEAMTVKGLGYSTAYIQTENRAMWGVLLEISSGAFLKDRKIFNRGISRWRELFKHDIVDNIPVGEVQRESNGLHYCNFLLDPMTQAAEIARFNGEWLYDYKTSDSSYKGLWETVSRWTALPETYPYWEGSSTVRIRAHVDPLHILWPNEYSQMLIDRYTTTQDYVGYRGGILAYRKRPLFD